MIALPSLALPGEIESRISAAALEGVTIGCSGNDVFCALHNNGAISYLKIAPRPNDPDLLDEKSKLEWLYGKLPVAEVEAFTSTDTHTYLLLSGVPGLMACDPAFVDRVLAVIRALAEGMRLIHSISIEDCPFNQRLDSQLTAAYARMKEGTVDTADFDEARQGAYPADLLAFLQTNRPIEDAVFTHGDYCLPNILIDPATMRISGFIDVHRAGIADRYQDIALAVRSLIYNFGTGEGIQTAISDAELAKMLYHEYGLDKPDLNKVEYYQVLDEFF